MWSRASSAKRSVFVCDVVVVDNLSGMSLMKTRNRTGPRCEPCGTPAVMLCFLDWVLSAVTVIVQVER